MMEVKALKNGPVIISKPFEVDGVFYSQIALCRCGQSNNKPFCDGTHKAVNFVAVETLLRSVDDK